MQEELRALRQFCADEEARKEREENEKRKCFLFFLHTQVGDILKFIGLGRSLAAEALGREWEQDEDEEDVDEEDVDEEDVDEEDVADGDFNVDASDEEEADLALRLAPVKGTRASESSDGDDHNHNHNLDDADSEDHHHGKFFSLYYYGTTSYVH
jgi:hypothetical protein